MPIQLLQIKQITGLQRRRLLDEIVLKSFDREALDRFLGDRFTRTLQQLSSDANFIKQCEQVVDWFNDNRLIGEFCNELHGAFPNRAALLEEILSDKRTSSGRNPLRDYLYLFDRADEEDLFVDALLAFPEHSPVPPVVVVISGVPEDEAYLMLDRIMQRAIPRLYGSPYQKEVPYMLNWVTTVSVDKLVRELARKILDVPALRDSVDDLVSKMKSRIAGQTVCMTLPAHLMNPQTAQILGEFFAQWSRLGSHELPPVFFLLVLDREAQEAVAESSMTPAEAYAIVKKACTPCGELVTVVDHLALSLCNSTHIRIWRSDLDGHPVEQDVVKSACDLLETILGDQTPFRLRRVKSELGAHLG
jgi:hypothetical protein